MNEQQETCPSACAATHPGREHGYHHPKCYQSTSIPDHLPDDICDCRVFDMFDRRPMTAEQQGSVPTCTATSFGVPTDDHVTSCWQPATGEWLDLTGHWIPVCDAHGRGRGVPEDHLRPLSSAEQQGSDESGEGLREAERIAAGRIRHGVGSSEDFPGNVCHLVSPIVGWMRLMERDGKPFNDLGHTIDRLSLVLDMARAEASRAESAEAALATARRDADEMRDRLAAVEALADEWEEWARDRSTPRIDAFRDATESLRAALANPSAARGEGEVPR